MTDPATLTDLERAARFLYLQRLTFGGQVIGVFGVAPSHGPRFSLARLEPVLEAAHERLDGVVFEALDWFDIIRRYDTPDTLFYLDPPYMVGERDYGAGLFERGDFDRMARALAEIRGSFLLSINDLPQTREIFRAFRIEPVSLRYSVSRSGTTEAAELLVSNFDPGERLL